MKLAKRKGLERGRRSRRAQRRDAIGNAQVQRMLRAAGFRLKKYIVSTV